MADVFFPQIKRRPKPNVITDGQFISSGNYVHPTATGVIVTGTGNVIGAGCKNITLIGCTNCVVSSGLSNVTLTNANGRVVQSNDVNITTGTFSVTIPTASVLTLNTTPILLVPAVAGVIDPTSITMEGVFNTAVYTTNTALQVYVNTSTANSFELVSALEFTGNCLYKFTQIVGNPAFAGGTQLKANEGLYIKTATADPLVGDSDIIIHGTYRII